MAKGNIPGIYNYCDRWCERCSFTSRCAVYADESQGKPGERDTKNKAFWDRLSQNFAKAHSMLEQAAEKFGIDLEAVNKEITHTEDTHEKNFERMMSHPLIMLAREYSAFSHEWLRTQPGMLHKLEKLKENLTMGIESHEVAKVQTHTIRECLEVIQWYETFLEPKLMRALTGKADAFEFGLEDDDPSDADGSAKVALIGIERTMHAWTQLFELLPEQEDHFLKALSMLEKMKRVTNEEFPGARAFVRPGFDENL
jgi:hypothetical protein